MFQKYKLKELTIEKGMVDGPFGSDLPASDYTVNGIPIIRGTNLSKGKYKFADKNYKFVSEKTANRLSRSICIPNDIIFTKKGTIGQVGIVPSSSRYKKFIISSNQMRMRVDISVVIPLFLYYYLSSPRIIKQIRMESMTTGVPKINLGYIKEFKVKIPSLPTQKKIANILSAYDDLIENNNQRIQLLEEMAAEIYKEWFVRFRFPGYESATFVDKEGKEVPHGTDGALPLGWERTKIGNIIEVKRGSSPRPISNTKYFERGNIPWLKIADATASKIFIYKTKEYVNDYGASFSRKLPAGSIIVAASGTLGFPMFLAVEACIHDGWLYFSGISDDLKEYFYFSFFDLKQYFENISYGAAIQNINTEIVRKAPLLLPNEKVIKEFKKNIEPIFNSINNLQQKNIALQQTRDLLLPRLISGKLSVENLELSTIKETSTVNS